MPVTPTYPGVYIEEIPSGVRTITGVSTSNTAFLGAAKRGPINQATRILSFADYERKFGGLDGDSEMSYAVRQFFLNGGNEAYIVRLAKNSSKAAKILTDAERQFLRVQALSEGQTGNHIEVGVDYPLNNLGSAFNLTITYTSSDNPADNRVERFEGLSMSPRNPRYVVEVLNGGSELVAVEDLVNQTSTGPLNELRGSSDSDELIDPAGILLDVSALVDASHNRFRLSINAEAPIEVILNPTGITGADPAAKFNTLCGLIQSQVERTYPEFTCVQAGNRIRMISGRPGPRSSVQVLSGLSNDVSSRLKLGAFNGGIETEAVAAVRPGETLDRFSLRSGAIASLRPDLPSTSNQSLTISLDGGVPQTISLGNTPATGSTFATRLANIAARIQAAVRAVQPTNPAYRNFSCRVTVTTSVASNVVTSQYSLVLASGTVGIGSAIAVTAAASADIATILNLVGSSSNPPTSMPPDNLRLAAGNEELFSEDDVYSLLFNNAAERKGIFALDAVDLFNLLCLPGVTNSSVLIEAAAYCRQRRAFLIADAPRDTDKPDEMASHISGTNLPKTDYGAVYYPWIYAADPLNNGKPRLIPPSGTIAGLYARIDSTRGIWKAPAGTEATLIGVQKVDYLLTDAENGVLNPLGVNCIRIFPGYGAVAWGARTLRGADEMTSDYKYIPIRRLALYLEESLYRGLKWVVFEPNDEPLWAQIRLNIGAFMNNLFRQGAFQGKTPREAYFVKCDKETTTQNDINLGIVNIVVGFAPLKPAEFVVLKIQQIAGQIAT